MTRAGIVAVPVANVRRMDLSWVERQPVAVPLGKPLAPGSVRIAGADAVATLYLPAILDAYSRAGGGRDPLWSRGSQSSMRTFSTATANRGRFVAEVRSTHSLDAVQALAGRQADIALMSRRMLPDEVRALSRRGLGNMYAPQQEHELAASAIAVVVHRSNTVKVLSQEQIADIFSGKVRNWSDVGGSHRRIQVFAPEDGSGILDVFRSEVLGGRNVLGTATRLHTDAEISDTVSIDAAAIGLVDYSAVGNAAALALVDSCGRPVAPTAFSIQMREYPLLTSHYLYAARN
jgi:phosphate transport system substrate-binding protein